jgi:hypothetical protein
MKNRNLEHKDHWATPQSFMEQHIIPIFENNKGKEFFDPCPLHADFDGLGIEWKEQNYINPPYSRKLKEAFIKKAFEESKRGKLCIMLLPVSTSTNIFHDIIIPNAEVRFVKKRIPFRGVNTFGEKVGDGSAPMHDSMIVIFGRKPNLFSA